MSTLALGSAPESTSERPEVESFASRLAWVAPFILFFLVQLAHHQLWRDELNAWGIAAAAPNPKVLYQYIRYEGHPALWYGLLWLISRFTSSPLALRIVEACIGVSVYLALALYSPFNRWQRVLLYLGYFISFEYTVPARMYGLTLLFTLLYLQGRTTRPGAWWRNSVLLALIANTDTIGLILSGALAIEYVLSALRSTDLGSLLKQTAFRLGCFTYSLGIATTLFALRISPHITHRERTPLFALAHSKINLIFAFICSVGIPWFPIYVWDLPNHWWNPVPDAAWKAILPSVVTLIALVFYAFIFWRKWPLWALIGTTIVGSTALNHLIYFGSTRHFGVTYLGFLSALWILRYSTGQTGVLANILLAVSALGGLVAAVEQWHHPFSQGPATVSWLRDHHLDNQLLLATPDTGGAEIGELLQKPVYSLDCNCTSRFLLYSNVRDNYGPWLVPERLRVAQAKLNRSAFTLITIYPMAGRLAADLQRQHIGYHLLAQFTGAEEPQENYYVYKIAMPDRPPSTQFAQ